MSYMQSMIYQENLLCKALAEDGHEVIVIAPNTLHRIYKKIEFDKALLETPDTMDGRVRIIRRPIKMYTRYFYTIPALYKLLEDIKPDILFVHSNQQVPLLVATRYAKKHKNMTFYVDNHAEFCNTAQNYLSKEILHKVIYKAIIHHAYSRLDRIFYVSEEAKELLIDLYKLPATKMEFYPVGGNIIDGEARAKNRLEKRRELNLADDDILICITGKLDAGKKTLLALTAFSKVKSDKLKLVIIGTFSDDIKEAALDAIGNDNRIQFIGWKKGDELLKYLCAADLYVQPGNESATLENAICCGVPVMVRRSKNYEMLLNGNHWFIDTMEDMIAVLHEICADASVLEAKSEASYKLAYEILDYRILARRLYH